MIKLKSKISNGTYEIIKVDENFKECGNIYEGGIPKFYIYEPEKKKIEKKIRADKNIEKLTSRYELRLTDTEKAIITALKDRGVNISEQIRSFIISLDEQIARELNQVKYEQFQEKYSEVLAELDKMYKYKIEYQYLRGETEIEVQSLNNVRENVRKSIKFLERKKEKISEFLAKYEAVFSSSEHPKG